MLPVLIFLLAVEENVLVRRLDRGSIVVDCFHAHIDVSFGTKSSSAARNRMAFS